MATRTRVGELLMRAGVIDELQLRSAMARYDQWGGRLGKIVSELGLADDETIAAALAKATGLPRIRLGTLTRDAAALARLDAAYCAEKGVFPAQLRDGGKSLALAMADPTDLTLVDDVAMRARARVIPLVASEIEISHAILRLYKNQEPSSPGTSRAREAVRTSADDLRLAREPTFDESSLGSAAVPTEPSLSRQRPAPSESQAGRMIDALILGEAGEEWTPEERAQLESLRANQQRSSAIVRALVELLMEKGYLTRRELEARSK